MTNVTAAELDTIRSLVATWRAKQPRNLLRSTYYDGKMPLKPTGNIPPEAFHRIKAVLGWPEKSVSGLAERTVFDGYVSPGQTQDPFGLTPLLEANRFDLDLPQAIVSAYKHSCSFMTIARGDTQAGEPEVLVMARSAEWSAGLWDKRRRAVSAALAVTATDDNGNPTAMDVYLPGLVLLCARRPSGSWVAERRAAQLQEVLVEPLAYDPQLDRPFGRSRISRAVMNITDHALTTIVRTEIGADFYAVPRMAALGVAEDAFKRGKWQAAIDRWFALTRDEEGELPSVQQFAQMTMQPLMDQYRMYASQFSGETGLPVSALGIVQDNPPSAEALYAAEKDLIVKARATTKTLGAALRQVARKVVLVRDGKTEASDELRAIQTNWLNPAFTSPVTAADALVKLATVFPWLGETEDGLRYAGFTEAEITRLLADKRRAQTGARTAALIAAGQQAAATPEE
ncbi:phage portal protein [Cellulomonas sp. ACRRI]|uniref:phage portal protein n=1 Tax=Cellulomonas sp. ACRRI TaxID=2918188 RepID=UPI001EF35972|nr:phage portal protein [Cellulomonas sp. ACRRI]MCG7284973.1 phage portal protein [Cellulomonas sp. ACRRI]